MTRESAGTLWYDAELAAKMPPGANTTDLVMVHTIMDADEGGGEPLRMHGKKVFNTNRPAEPVALKDVEIIKIAYRPGG